MCGVSDRSAGGEDLALIGMVLSLRPLELVVG